jgi:hypothetical protein
LYTETLSISSNDPAHASVAVPVTLKVLFNTPPVLAPIAAMSVIETTTANVTFTASDIDNEPVSVVLHNAPAFVTLLSSTSGSASYKIAPVMGNGGTYDLPVIATDARGKSDTAVFHLTVIPYGVQSFTLFNTKTNQPIATFVDQISVDIAHPDYNKLVIIANTSPDVVGSVKFSLDNHTLNTDNTKAYTTVSNVLKNLEGGDHTLVARSFTKKDAKGSEGKSLTAIVRIINSGAVTDFDVVKINGSKLIDLVNGTVIDAKNPAYCLVNIKANTAGGIIKSVDFVLNGKKFRIDNLAPYMLGGLGTLIDLPIPPVPGSYTLTATPYSEAYASGIAGQSLTVSFTVVHGTTATTAARENETARSSSPDDVDAEVDPDDHIRIYPVPARDELNVELIEKVETHVGFVMHNAQGQRLFTDEGSSNRFRKYSINLQELGLKPGFYFIQFQYPDGKREVRKFIQE